MTDDKRIIEVASKDFYQEVDGFIVWDPGHRGFWESWALRVVADELDRLNAPWEAEIQRYFDDGGPAGNSTEDFEFPAG